MPEGLVANLEQAGLVDDDLEEELEETDDDNDNSSDSGPPIIH